MLGSDTPSGSPARTGGGSGRRTRRGCRRRAERWASTRAWRCTRSACRRRTGRGAGETPRARVRDAARSRVVEGYGQVERVHVGVFRRCVFFLLVKVEAIFLVAAFVALRHPILGKLATLPYRLRSPRSRETIERRPSRRETTTLYVTQKLFSPGRFTPPPPVRGRLLFPARRHRRLHLRAFLLLRGVPRVVSSSGSPVTAGLAGPRRGVPP